MDANMRPYNYLIYFCPMKWMRSFALSGWLFLFTAFLAEQCIGPFILPDFDAQVGHNEPITHYNKTGPVNDFYIQSNSNQIAAPVPVVKEPLFKWKSFLPERSFDSFFFFNQFSELIQDIWRCPAVSIVLFPYHEFM